MIIREITLLDDEVDADYILRYWKQYETANYPVV